MKRMKNESAKKLLVQTKDRALAALRCAIKDCAQCSQVGAILCTDCEARYKALLRGGSSRAETQR